MNRCTCNKKPNEYHSIQCDVFKVDASGADFVEAITCQGQRIRIIGQSGMTGAKIAERIQEESLGEHIWVRINMESNIWRIRATEIAAIKGTPGREER